MRFRTRTRTRGSLSSDHRSFHSVILAFRCLAAFVPIFSIFLCKNSAAQFASRFSLSIAEEYNDNIFFSKQREHDFITNITPTFTLLYQPPVASASPFTLNISPTGQIFALHPKQNNFGDGLNINGGYNYQYSPRLSFNVMEAFQTIGRTQTGPVGGSSFNQLPLTPTAPAGPGVPISSQNLASFIPNGRTLNNQLSLSGAYLFAPDITISGGYANSFINYLDQGGTDFGHSIGIRGSYRWRQEHNLHVGYTLSIFKSRNNGDDGVVHNINIGDDYFSSTQIQLTPTLTLGFSTGISLNTSGQGPRIANNTNVQLTKIWERASLTASVRKGLTSSQGVSGISDTIDFTTSFNILLTERLSGYAGADYSFFNTDDVNFKPFRAYGGLQYGITSWLCSGARYTHRRLFSGAGGQNTVLQTQGNVYGNSLFLFLTASFDVWPNFGLARGQGCAATVPAGTPQFPQGSQGSGL